MSTDSQKYSGEAEKDVPHSAFQEFSRDERRPAVLLLAGLVIAAVFFALGIMFGRWTDKQRGLSQGPEATQQGSKSTVNRPSPTPSQSPTPSPTTSTTRRPSPRSTAP